MSSLNKHPRIGIGVIVIKRGTVLLGKRKNSHGEGNWAFPGGHLEFGESPEECAMRELAEETGLIATTIIAGPWVNNVFEDKHYVTLFMFIPEFTGVEIVLEPHKCEGWQWFDWRHLPEPLFPPIQSLNSSGFNGYFNREAH